MIDDPLITVFNIYLYQVQEEERQRQAAEEEENRRHHLLQDHLILPAWSGPATSSAPSEAQQAPPPSLVDIQRSQGEKERRVGTVFVCVV